MSNGRPSIHSLVGEELSEVSFVRDYVEFHFDDPVLRALSGPIVVKGEDRYRFPDVGSRDQLCALIGSTVSDLIFQENVAIDVRFAGGQRVVVPLDEASRTGPEAAHFQSKRVSALLDVF